MTRTYKTKELPAHESTYLDKIKCCYCGRETSSETSENVGNWHEDPVYEFKQIIVRKEEGARYPSDSWGEIEEWDICPECFEKHIRPVLPEDSHKHKWDY